MNRMSQEEIDTLKERIMHPKATSVSIKRVPKETEEAFKKFANDEFVGDYGMALKYLVDKVLIEPLPFQQVYAILEDHENRLAKIEGVGAKKIIKTISGREIGKPKPKEDEENGKQQP